ncbi:MAG: DJ-1/PfpI family protein [Rhodobacteraceae bacterium]|nr:DJ-1/PfpI family protein [Paracoccaceae bacterium]
MKILIATSTTDFDPTEVAVPWKLLSEAGHDVHFATDTGEMGAADPHMLEGKYFGIWTKLLIAREDARDAYAEMLEDTAFQNPMGYDAIKVTGFDGLLLPGGHAEGVKPYMESEVLRAHIVDFFTADKPVGAICHGVVTACRAINPETGKSVLFGRKTTALLKRQEMVAYNLTKALMNEYYRTYPTSVQEEVMAALEAPSDFHTGKNPMRRDMPNKLKRGFVVKDGNYVSARWPGDIYNFTNAFMDLLTD